MDGAAAPGSGRVRAPPRVEGGIFACGEFSFVALSPLTMTPPGGASSSAANEIALRRSSVCEPGRAEPTAREGTTSARSMAFGGESSKRSASAREPRGCFRAGRPWDGKSPKREGNETETAI